MLRAYAYNSVLSLYYSPIEIYVSSEMSYKGDDAIHVIILLIDVDELCKRDKNSYKSLNHYPTVQTRKNLKVYKTSLVCREQLIELAGKLQNHI